MSLGSGYGAARAWDTLLGAAVGVVVNVLLAPPTYVQAAGLAVRRVAEDLGVLLADIGDRLCRAEWSDRTARDWLRRARAGRDELLRAHAAAAASRDRVAAALADHPTADGTDRILAALHVDADRMLYEVNPQHGAHTAAVPAAPAPSDDFRGE